MGIDCSKCGRQRNTVGPNFLENMMSSVKEGLKRGRLRGVKKSIDYMVEEIRRMMDSVYLSPLLLVLPIPSDEAYELYEAHAWYESKRRGNQNGNKMY